MNCIFMLVFQVIKENVSLLLSFEVNLTKMITCLYLLKSQWISYFSLYNTQFMVNIKRVVEDNKIWNKIKK